MPNNDEADRKQSDLKGLSFAYRISSELVAALIVSVILGLAIDKFLDLFSFKDEKIKRLIEFQDTALADRALWGNDTPFVEPDKPFTY